MSGFDDFGRLERDLRKAPREALAGIEKAVGVAAGRGKATWADAASGHRYSGRYPASIDYDDVEYAGGAFVTDLGPNPGRGGSGLGIVEDSPGGVRGTPQRNYVKAEAVIEPDLDRGIEIAIDQALRNNGL